MTKRFLWLVLLLLASPAYADMQIRHDGSVGATGPSGPSGPSGPAGPSLITSGGTTITSGTNDAVCYQAGASPTGTIKCDATSPQWDPATGTETLPAVSAQSNLILAPGGTQPIGLLGFDYGAGNGGEFDVTFDGLTDSFAPFSVFSNATAADEQTVVQFGAPVHADANFRFFSIGATGGSSTQGNYIQSRGPNGLILNTLNGPLGLGAAEVFGIADWQIGIDHHLTSVGAGRNLTASGRMQFTTDGSPGMFSTGPTDVAFSSNGHTQLETYTGNAPFTGASDFTEFDITSPDGTLYGMEADGADNGRKLIWYQGAAGGTLRLEFDTIKFDGSFLATIDGGPDIGASGVNRPNNLFLKGVATLGTSAVAANNAAGNLLMASIDHPVKTFTATYDPGTLAAQTGRTDTVTVTGIKLAGGAVSASPGVDVATGCVLGSVRASADDTVKITWFNAITAVTACDTASSTWTFTQQVN